MNDLLVAQHATYTWSAIYGVMEHPDYEGLGGMMVEFKVS